MAKLPSPCLGVCKFRREDHCIACSMTKPQKALSKKLKTPKLQEAFLTLLVHQQRDLGNFPAWRRAYLRKCARKGVARLPAILAPMVVETPAAPDTEKARE